MRNLEDDEHVAVRKPSFLEFNDVDIGCVRAEDVLGQLFQLQFEDSRHEIWSVRGCLAGIQILLDFLPFGVASHSLGNVNS